MTRLILAPFLVLLCSWPAAAKVKIHLPAQRYKRYDKIHASVENAQNRPITFCIDVAQSSAKGGGEIEVTPSPFLVQQRSGGTWATLLIGADVGGGAASTVLDPGNSVEFIFRLGSSGQTRLRLKYWNGSSPDLDCSHPPKGRRFATSAVFTIE